MSQRLAQQIRVGERVAEQLFRKKSPLIGQGGRFGFWPHCGADQ
jgi:hypothetical protein